MDLMDVCTSVSGLSYPSSTSFCSNYLLPFKYLDSVHRKELSLWTIVPLTLGICCAGYYLEGNYHYPGVYTAMTWISTYMDSGFRISKTLHVNPALTLSTPKLVVTGTARG